MPYLSILRHAGAVGGTVSVSYVLDTPHPPNGSAQAPQCLQQPLSDMLASCQPITLNCPVPQVV